LEALECACSLDRIEVLALDILHQGKLEHAEIVEIVTNDGGNAWEPSQPTRAPTPFSSDNLEVVSGPPDNNWLQHTVLPDAIP
jgi:hypothetical protein